MDRAVGSITSCIPLANLESVKSKLLTTFTRDQSEEDITLKRILAENIKNVEAEIKVELGNALISAGDVIELEKGDIIQLDKRRDDHLPVYIAGVKKFMGSPGIHRGNKALIITRKAQDK